MVDEDGQYKALFQLNNLTADRTYTLPDASDTLALSTDVSNLIDGTTPFTGIDINGGTVDDITSLTVANDFDIGDVTMTAKGLVGAGNTDRGVQGTSNDDYGVYGASVNSHAGYFAGTLVATGQATLGSIDSGLITATDTTQQLKLKYDNSSYADFIVDASGNLAITTSGTKVDFGDENLSTTGTGQFANIGVGTSPSSAFGVKAKNQIAGAAATGLRFQAITFQGVVGNRVLGFDGFAKQHAYTGDSGATYINAGRVQVGYQQESTYNVNTYEGVGLRISQPFFSKSGTGTNTINNSIGISIASQNTSISASSIINQIGIEIADQTGGGTTNRAIKTGLGDVEIGDHVTIADGLDVTGISTFGDGINETQISATGDLTFAGSAGLAYGIIAGDDQTVTCTTINVWYQVTFDEVGDENLMTGSAATDDITVGQTGTYDIDIHASINTTNAQDIEIKLCKNNCANDLFHAHLFVTTGVSAKTLGSSVRTIDALTKDDTLECWVRCTSASGKVVTFEHVSIMAIMIGG